MEEARTVLKRLRQAQEDPNDIAAKEEFYQISEQLKLDEAKLKATGHSKWVSVWKKPSYRRRMISKHFLTDHHVSNARYTRLIDCSGLLDPVGCRVQRTFNHQCK